VAVATDANGRPRSMRRSAGTLKGSQAVPGDRLGPLKAVASIRDRWRLDDEWWRERPVSRLYYALLLEDGALLVVFQDLIEGGWYEQRA
jgi:hypothetical protein